MSKRVQEMEKVCRDYNVVVLYVFGSRVAEMIRALEDDTYFFKTSESDLDIAVLTQSPLSIENKISLTLELEELFNAPRVDLSVLQETDAFLAANIIRGERVYAADSYLADEYELFVLRRAGDLADLERERMALILQEG